MEVLKSAFAHGRIDAILIPKNHACLSNREVDREMETLKDSTNSLHLEI
jgi:hypothetical protein